MSALNIGEPRDSSIRVASPASTGAMVRAPILL